MQTMVTKEIRVFDGEFSLVVKDLVTGTRYTHNASTPAYLASGVKILVMISVFEEIYQGRLQWDDEVLFTENDVRDGVYVLLPGRVGESFCIEDLVEWMMKKSDNAATDLLIKRLGIDLINRVTQKYGGSSFGHITSLVGVRRQIYRELDVRAQKLSNRQYARLARHRPLSKRVRRFAKMIGADEDAFSLSQLLAAYQAYYQSGLNSAPLEAVARLLESLERGEVVHPAASWDMLGIMRRCQTGRRRIRAGLPEALALAHKTGTQLKRMCDLGIVYLPSARPVVFTACLKDYSSRRKAENLLASLAKRTVELLDPSLIPAPIVPAEDLEPSEPKLVPILNAP